MGWDNFKNKPEKILVEDFEYEIEGIVQKRDFVIAQCKADKIPDNRVRKIIENKYSNLHYEHLLVFYDEAKTKQIWQFSIKEENKPKTVREFHWFHMQDTEALFQRFRNLLFHIDEEENITLLDVLARVNDNFARNTDKVTKKFYDEFKKYHTKFLGYIENINDELKDDENKNKQWYASIMLNRLMFCYFIQKKGFLDSNIHYLQEKLKETKQKAGNNNFYSFYKDFLLALFHEGLGKPKVSRTTRIELGNIPYLNGGLFEVHQLESEFEDIQIKDEFFGLLFDFFDQWNWHLDQRSESSGKDINPDVVGYIFEKYINDRAAMGAYYTKEDITEYISKNTIIPFIFDEVKRNYPKPFKEGGEFTELLKCSGDDYIYDAVKKGIKESSEKGKIPDRIEDLNIPENIRTGLDTTKSDLLERRKDWNRKTPSETALPTEIWRETIDRWKRYFDIRHKLKNCEIKEINDLITYNLNIRQYAQDLLSISDDPKLINETYKALSKITVLDPTCGSGAFLFAALNILEPLYETCIDRMRDMIGSKKVENAILNDFIAVIKEADSPNHPNLRYYIYKSIILNNLYGVDIMREAVEIAKLRLFLKLVAEVEPDTRKQNYGLEPLPDIDFNIRTGNTLVGFANENELYTSIENHDALFAEDKIKTIKQECELVSKTFKHYQDSQLNDDSTGKNIRKAKKELQDRLNTLNQQLNKYLAGTYGIWEDEYGKDKKKYKQDYEQWLQSHQPFHWFSEFYEIIKAKGGFDVIIGNPPYVEYSQVRKEYTIKDYETESCGNLFALAIERVSNLNTNLSKFSMIVPISSVSTPRMNNLCKILYRKYNSLFISNYSVRPDKLFTGVDMNLTIILGTKNVENNEESSFVYSTRYNRWYTQFRDYLFELLEYAEISDFKSEESVFKIGKNIEVEILEKIWENKKLKEICDIKINPDIVYFHSGGRYFRKCVKEKYSNEYKELSTAKGMGDYVICILSSSLYYWFWILESDCYHVTKKDIHNFLLPKDNSGLDMFGLLSDKYLTDLKKNSEVRLRNRADGEKQKEINFYVGKSKPIMDEIDKVLAVRYGFTEEELDFIINYDIKYRMGDELENEGEE
ncbi:MAG: Eco57I restriction-modification methylase domain-containing protein [Candidatus Cloacimonetes bacterium]|nr:Eco57I restriction-modification methylase domain-containing protein [Candidatus Cloacimonadota bacterium]